jgi:hypothetical protein
MASITAIAHDFFAACETGKGWDVCRLTALQTRPSPLRRNRLQRSKLLRNMRTG